MTDGELPGLMRNRTFSSVKEVYFEALKIEAYLHGYVEGARTYAKLREGEWVIGYEDRPYKELLQPWIKNREEVAAMIAKIESENPEFWKWGI
jgi:hypothetical protein